jgi:hypothetical protein
MATVSERATKLAEQAEEDFAESWRPDKESPARLVGAVVRYTTAPTQYGDKTICVVRDEEGNEWSVWLLQAALVAAFGRERPKPGELVLIDYQGQKKSERTGRRYHAFRLVVERDDKPVLPDFDAMAAEADGGTDTATPATDVPADTSGLVADADDQGEEGETDVIPF